MVIEREAMAAGTPLRLANLRGEKGEQTTVQQRWWGKKKKSFSGKVQRKKERQRDHHAHDLKTCEEIQQGQEASWLRREEKKHLPKGHVEGSKERKGGKGHTNNGSKKGFAKWKRGEGAFPPRQEEKRSPHSSL